MTSLKSLARMAVIAVGVLSLTSCSGMDEGQQRMVSGGAVGAVVGTVGTAITGGCIPCGTAIGGAVGVATGYVMNHLDANTKSSSPSASSGSYSSNNYASNSSSNNSAGGGVTNYTSSSGY